MYCYTPMVPLHDVSMVLLRVTENDEGYQCTLDKSFSMILKKEL